MSNDRPWRIADSTYVIDTPFMRLRKDTVILPNGRQVDDFFVRETRGFVIIFAITPDEHILFTREYRHGFGAHLLGLPGGQVDAGEEPIDCARRELAEETGYTGSAPEFVASFIIAPVNSNGSFWVYAIRDAKPTTTQKFDTTEDIALELYPLAKVHDMVREGTTRISEHALAIYAALDYLGKL